MRHNVYGKLICKGLSSYIQTSFGCKILFVCFEEGCLLNIIGIKYSFRNMDCERFFARKTKQNSSRMRTVRLPTTCVLVATTRCQYRWGIGLQVNKFEQVSSDDHQMSVAGRKGYPCPNTLWVMVTWDPPEQKNQQTSVKTLPSGNFVCGR